MAVEFNTTEYEFSHSHTPRGRGSWCFWFSRSDMRAGNFSDAFWTPGSTTYAEAKKMVRAEAKRRNVTEVFVGS